MCPRNPIPQRPFNEDYFPWQGPTSSTRLASVSCHTLLPPVAVDALVPQGTRHLTASSNADDNQTSRRVENRLSTEKPYRLFLRVSVHGFQTVDRCLCVYIVCCKVGFTLHVSLHMLRPHHASCMRRNRFPAVSWCVCVCVAPSITLVALET